MTDRQHLASALALGLFLLSIYWLTASGAFHSIDEHAVFAVSRNLLFHGGWDQSALFWGEPYLHQARVGLDGELYSKYGIGHSLLLLAPLAIGRVVPGATLGSSAMLLDMVATALTGVLLALSARRLGYEGRVGIVLALLFGLATFAWVYARTMFSEPLVALGWMAALWLLLGSRGAGEVLLAGTILALTVAIRPASILLVPFFALLLLDRRPRLPVGRLSALGLPLLLVVAALLLFNQWRFGDPLEFGYSETFDGSLVEGLLGFLFSLDRSLFLFAPPLLALPLSLARFLRRHARPGWLILAISLFSLLAYSMWPVFWGGPVWGPRYLLPNLPLLMLLLAPAVEAAWEGGWQRWLLLLLALLGGLMQLPGVLWNSLPLTQELGQRYPLWMLAPRSDWVDVAWFYGQPQGFLLAGLLALLALAALLRPRPALVASAALAMLVASPLLLAWQGRSELGYEGQPAYESTLARLAEAGQPGDALLLNPAPYQDPMGELIWFLNRPRLEVPPFGLYREPPEAQPVTGARLEQLLDRYGRLWLLTQGVGLGDPNSTAERALAEQAPLVHTEWLEEGYRLTLFESPRPATLSGAPGISLDGLVTLERWEVAWPGATPNSLQVTLRWEPRAVPSTALHTFVQLLDEQGQLVAGWDGVPQSGFAPAPTWRPGAPVNEYLALMLPADLPPGSLRLIAGLYDPGSGRRLMTPGGEDAVELGRIGGP